MNWTQEQYEAFKQGQISKRLEYKELKRKAEEVEKLKKKLKKKVEEPALEQDVRPLPKSLIRHQNHEYRIQAAFVREMSRRFPSILVFSDCAAHIKKTMFQQKRANALSTKGEKWPDVFVAQPSGDYAGFYIEFKADSPFKKDGVELLKNDHIEAQAATMQRLRERGYKCAFAWDAERAVRMVEDYLNL